MKDACMSRTTETHVPRTQEGMCSTPAVNPVASFEGNSLERRLIGRGELRLILPIGQNSLSLAQKYM